MVTTQEGLHLVQIHENKDFFKTLNDLPNKIDQKGLADLQLADADYNTYVNNKVIGKIMVKLCKIFHNHLELFKLTENRFMRILDENRNPLVLYSSHNTISIPTCVNVDVINVKEKTERCYKDISVQFTINNQESNGFLNEDGFLTKFSSQVKCDSTKKFYFPNSNEILIVQNNTVRIETIYFKKMKLNAKMKQFDLLNFHHSKQVLEGINTIEDFIKLDVQKEGEDNIVVERSSLDISDTSDQLKNSNKLTMILKILATISTIILLIATIIFIILFKKPLNELVMLLMRIFRCRKTDNSNITVKFSKSEDQVSVNNKRLYPSITKPETETKEEEIPLTATAPIKHTTLSLYNNNN